MNPLLALAEKRRSAADLLRRYGDEQGAIVCELHAGDLEAAWREWELEELTLDKAAQESGYTRSALEKMIQRGGLKNAGEPGRPRVRRRDCPKRAAKSDGNLDSWAEELVAARGP